MSLATKMFFLAKSKLLHWHAERQISMSLPDFSFLAPTTSVLSLYAKSNSNMYNEESVLFNNFNSF